MEILAGPSIEYREPRPCLAIHQIAPFRGMLAVRDALWAEVFRWLETRGLGAVGQAFLRLNVVDMRGEMDIDAGVVIDKAIAGDDRVRAGVLPGGHYATLTYRNHSIRANGHLIDWIARQPWQIDRSADPRGDRFASRYELNLSDPRRERRRTQWAVQLCFLVRPRPAPAAQGV